MSPARIGDRPLTMAETQARYRSTLSDEERKRRYRVYKANTMARETPERREARLLRDRERNARLSPEYVAWKGAKARVSNPNGKDWPRYGGRGIRMAPEWLDDFPAFLAHIGPRPGPGYSLDRIDVDGDYAPGNVRWADALTQRHNRRVSYAR